MGWPIVCGGTRRDDRMRAGMASSVAPGGLRLEDLSSVREIVWLTLVVALLAAIGADLGLHVATSFRADMLPQQTGIPGDQHTPDRQIRFSTDIWLVWLTGALVFVGSMQTVVFGLQAKRLKETVQKMDEVAAGQTSDMRASITEATRAATAMEQMSVSLARNTLIVAEMADSQRVFWQRQMRAYLSVNYGAVVPQDNSTGWRTEVRLILVNTGHTPAHDVSYQAKAAVLPIPLPVGFEFPIPDFPPSSKSVIGPGQNMLISHAISDLLSEGEIAEYTTGNKTRVYMWGVVTFKDVFGQEQIVKFCQFVQWMRGGTTMGINTLRHNEAT
jgi:hypothetical protein